jgi:hypothetical protein
MGDMVIVGYRPKPGREEELLALTREPVPALRRLGLATDRPALDMRSKSDVIIEVFEWCDGVIASARQTPEILKTKDVFAQFSLIDGCDDPHPYRL